MITSITDIVVAILLIQCILIGWRRSLLRAVIGPIAFLVCLSVGVIYFDLTQNLVFAILITTGGTVSLSLIATLVLILGRASVEKQYRNYSFWFNRILGSIVTIAWQGSIATGLILLLTVIPPQYFKIEHVQEDINRSRTYGLINYYVVSRNERIRNLMASLTIFQNPTELQELAYTKEFKEFFTDEKVLDLLSDQYFYELLKNKNYSEFISNQKIQDIIRDKHVMKKFTALSKRIYREKTEKPPAP